MENHKTTRRWSDLYKLDVMVPSEGKTLGTVEDFYLKEGSNAVYALSVRTRLYGDLTLPVTGIKSIDAERINIASAQMLLKAVPPLTHGQSLLARKVVDENGQEVGLVKDILLGIEPLVALRVAAFEITDERAGRGSHTFTSDGVQHYNDNVVVIYDHTAKKLR